jgi:hypothetical protein
MMHDENAGLNVANKVAPAGKAKAGGKGKTIEET